MWHTFAKKDLGLLLSTVGCPTFLVQFAIPEQVFETDHPGRFLPGSPELAIMEICELDMLMSHPLVAKWVGQKLAGLRILKVEWNPQPLAPAHKAVHAQEQLVGCFDSRQVFSLEPRVPPNVFGICSSEKWRPTAPGARECAARKAATDLFASEILDQSFHLVEDLRSEQVFITALVIEVELKTVDFAKLADGFCQSA